VGLSSGRSAVAKGPERASQFEWRLRTKDGRDVLPLERCRYLARTVRCGGTNERSHGRVEVEQLNQHTGVAPQRVRVPWRTDEERHTRGELECVELPTRLTCARTQRDSLVGRLASSHSCVEELRLRLSERWGRGVTGDGQQTNRE
jgi:hypothetical protein